MKPLLTVVDAVLFDLDGTLVETNIDFPLMKRRMIELATEQGLQPEALAELDILAIVDATAEFVGGDGAVHVRARAMAILEDIELAHARGTREIPFARELVGQLADSGIKTGVVTRNCRSASEVSLGITRMRPDVLVCREDCDRHKPHPDPVVIALRVLGARPEASIMVGDHLMDIQSGKAAGVRTIGFLREDRPAGFFDGVQPDLVVTHLREVLHAIIDCDS